jgi:hypothetical protein
VIRVTYDGKEVEGKVSLLVKSIEGGDFDIPVDAAAWKALAELVELTPRKWTGLTKKSWKVEIPQKGQRIVKNESKVMKWLEDGTGQSTGGYIYPTTALQLFIPLTQAAMFGWSEGMVYGTDYITRRRVKGITARHIVRDYAPKAQELLKEEMKKFLATILT